MLFNVISTNLQIAGVMHAFPVGEPAVPEWLTKAYDECEFVVTEHEIKGLAALIFTPEKNSTETALSPEVWSKLLGWWESEESLEDKKPWYVVESLSGRLCPQVAGAEVQLLSRDSKESFYLEETNAFVDLLDSLPATEYLRSVPAMVDDQARYARRLVALHGAWLECNLPKMNFIVGDSRFGMSAVMRRVLINLRNKNWLPAIRSFCDSPKKVLLMVGAIHLYGSDGIIKLVEADGYSTRCLV